MRLQTAVGEIKEYKTLQRVGGDYGPDKYVTKCGREWKNQPKSQEECDHLDCAIYLAEEQRDAGPILFVLFIAFATGIILWGHWIDFGGEIFVVSGFCILLAFWLLISGLRSANRFDELNEYKCNGMINGIKACQIFEDHESAKA